MICLLSANPHHNALRGGAASAVLIQGGRALLGCQISFAGLGWLLGGADQLLLIEAPPNFVCPRTGGGRLHFPTSTNVRGTRNTKRSTLKSQFVGAFRLAIVGITTQTRRNEWWGRTGVGLSGQLSNLSQPLTELTDGDLDRKSTRLNSSHLG